MAAAAGETKTCKLRDGRTYAWREYGDLEKGFPVIFLHGVNNSRLYTPAWENTEPQSQKAGARVIAVDRPGYGLSDNAPEAPGYSFWPKDLRDLVYHLQLQEFAILGYSSGGVCAMACLADAHAASPELPPGRFKACGLMCPDGPYKRMEAEVEQNQEETTRMMVFGSETLPFRKGQPETFAFMTERSLEETGNLREQYAGMGNEKRRKLALDDLEEALRQGPAAGSAHDGVRESGHWGFAVESVQGTKVPTLFWHGEDDVNVPVEVGRFHAAHFGPGIQTTFVPGESHTMLRRRWESALAEVIAVAKSPQNASSAKL